MLAHGGKLREAARRYGIPLEQWLDLSTGVNPRCYSIPHIPDAVWNRLPEDNDGLIEAASSYYGCPAVLPVAGSQAAIQSLPVIRRLFFPESTTVAVPAVGYREHRYAWEKHGFKIITYQDEPSVEQLQSADVVVIINPNNPTGYLTDKSSLMDHHALLAEHNGWLVVDEAFMDSTPEQSISPDLPLENLIVLRSVGKFFGLAGIRAGFVLAEEKVLQAMKEHLGPWSVSAPAREVSKSAFSDLEWQTTNRKFLKESGHHLHELLSCYFTEVRDTDLFSCVMTSNACTLHDFLCKQGVFTRLLDEKNGIRFGLPNTENDWSRLKQVLNKVKEEL